MPQFLSKDAIAAKQETVTDVVEVPEWGGSVKVRAMTSREFNLVVEARGNRGGNRAARRAKTPDSVYKNIEVSMVAWCAVDEEGNRLFADEDIPMLEAKAAGVIHRIADVISGLSGFDSEEGGPAIDEAAEDMVHHPLDDSSIP